MGRAACATPGSLSSAGTAVASASCCPSPRNGASPPALAVSFMNPGGIQSVRPGTQQENAMTTTSFRLGAIALLAAFALAGSVPGQVADIPPFDRKAPPGD